MWHIGFSDQGSNPGPLHWERFSHGTTWEVPNLSFWYLSKVAWIPIPHIEGSDLFPLCNREPLFLSIFGTVGGMVVDYCLPISTSFPCGRLFFAQMKMYTFVIWLALVNEVSFYYQVVRILWASLWLGNKGSTCSAGDTALISELGRSSGEGNGNPL